MPIFSFSSNHMHDNMHINKMLIKLISWFYFKRIIYGYNNPDRNKKKKQSKSKDKKITIKGKDKVKVKIKLKVEK